jgi:hypothetical protein
MHWKIHKWGARLAPDDSGTTLLVRAEPWERHAINTANATSAASLVFPGTFPASQVFPGIPSLSRHPKDARIPEKLMAARADYHLCAHELVNRG